VCKSGQTLHEALDAYKTWLHGRHLTPPEPGREQRTSQTGVKQGERGKALSLLKMAIATAPSLATATLPVSRDA